MLTTARASYSCPLGFIATAATLPYHNPGSSAGTVRLYCLTKCPTATGEQKGQYSTELGDLQGQQGVVQTSRPETVTPRAPTSKDPPDSQAGWKEIKGGEATKPGQSEDNEHEPAKE